MKTIVQMLMLIGIFALWGKAYAYEVVIDIDVDLEQSRVVQNPNQKMMIGTAMVVIQGKQQSFDLSSSNLSDESAEELAMEWLLENSEDLILSTGLDPNLSEVELEIIKQKTKCRGRRNTICHAQLSAKLTVRRL
ncbi:MAG: hypothetical protein CME71_00075 [Halobacteriovorax sp.]|nr:hypothetical protein [Halobacteriovorax sp.]|tara:strand:- start:187 stop:591 length:405 start_codon:yes stop_codon:yes gene_type:complete